MAELYEELKGRISQFNMCVDSRRPVVDQEHTYKQRFILQVCGRPGVCFRFCGWEAAHCFPRQAGRGAVAGPPCPLRAREQGELRPCTALRFPSRWVIQTRHWGPERVAAFRKGKMP